MGYFQGKTVLITGGASGIGFLMAKMLLSKGITNLIILDKDEKAESKFDFVDYSQTGLHVFTIDITNEANLINTTRKIKDLGLSVDILINNAGVVSGKEFKDHALKDIDLNMQVNSIAPMKLTSLFLPSMIERKEGDIVNISSAAGMIANPKMSVYCASKWAMNGWSQSLRLEMARENTSINVLTVTPYYINTGMFQGVQSPIVPILKAEKVAEKILKAIEKRRTILRTPKIIYLLPFIKGILPGFAFDWLMGKIFGIYNSMDEFKGRNNEEN